MLNLFSAFVVPSKGMPRIVAPWESQYARFAMNWEDWILFSWPLERLKNDLMNFERRTTLRHSKDLSKKETKLNRHQLYYIPQIYPTNTVDRILKARAPLPWLPSLLIALQRKTKSARHPATMASTSIYADCCRHKNVQSTITVVRKSMCTLNSNAKNSLPLCQSLFARPTTPCPPANPRRCEQSKARSARFYLWGRWDPIPRWVLQGSGRSTSPACWPSTAQGRAPASPRPKAAATRRSSLPCDDGQQSRWRKSKRPFGRSSFSSKDGSTFVL